MEDRPLVSVVCFCYNHGNYIQAALEGFVSQQTTFPFEVIVHDDASTDDSKSILLEYEEKYPHIFNNIYQSENQFSKGRGIVTRITYAAAKGKYMAFCEGDDYWTDSLKMQKQVDFLESHPDYTVTVGGFISRNIVSGDENTVIKRLRKPDSGLNGYTFTLEDTTKAWVTKTLTALFVNNQELLTRAASYKYGKDVTMFYHLLKEGKGFYFTEVFGVYNIHTGGVFSNVKRTLANYLDHYHIYKELYLANKDEYSRTLYNRSVRSLINSMLYSNEKSPVGLSVWRLLWEGSKISKGINDFKSLVLSVIPPKLKSSTKKIF